jgi:hypothetical protein
MAASAGRGGSGAGMLARGRLAGRRLPRTARFARFGFIYNWPTTLALCSRVSPPALSGVIMGVAFLTGAVAKLPGRLVGSCYEKLPPGAFRLIQSGIAAAGACRCWPSTDR